MSILLLAFESAAAFGGKFDGVFCTGFFFVKFEGEFDEAVDALRVGQTGRFPQLGVHADGSEAGNRVEFVDGDFSIRTVEEEIAARHASSLDRWSGANCGILPCANLYLR